MEIAFANHMTPEQIKAMTEFKDSLKAETIHIGQQVDLARRLPVKLPAKSHTGGSVLHGANIQVMALVHYWEGRLLLVRRFLTEVEINKIFEENGIKERV